MARPINEAFILVVLLGLAVLALAPVASARVLRVGTYKGIRGQYKSIQSAVDAARTGDWILIGPGDYNEHSGRPRRGHRDTTAGVLITKGPIHLRRMHRNSVVVDGTKPHSPRCSRKHGNQEFGPAGLSPGAGRRGLNGLLVWKAPSVTIQNLTVCNYLHGSGDTGNEIWWNGGDGSGKIGGWGYKGDYLTATSTFLRDETTAAQCGIFSSQQELRVRQQRGRLRHPHPERGLPPAAERRLSARRHQPDHPHALLLGVHGQLRA